MTDRDPQGRPRGDGGDEPGGNWVVRLLARSFGYFVIMLLLMMMSDRFGCMRGGSGVAKDWAQVFDNLPELAGIAAFAAAVLTVMHFVRKRHRK